MLMAATAAMTSASSPVISLARSEARLDSSRTERQRRAAQLPAPCAVMAERA